jgi:hypothetical protein
VTRADDLLANGFVHVRERHSTTADAWASARAIFDGATRDDAIGRGLPPLEHVGEFTVPPNGALRRPFQTLHIDFGLPVAGREPVDVARFTALHIDARQAPTSALTRIVSLRRLLSQRSWPDASTLAARLRRYGTGAVEGILARLVEAADGRSELPADLLCGMEFDSTAEEAAHFARHRLALAAVEHRVLLCPGELLVFDNLATAHGRIGTRRPNELHQRCVGYRRLDPSRQRTLLLRVLNAFSASSAEARTARRAPATRTPRSA